MKTPNAIKVTQETIDAFDELQEVLDKSANVLIPVLREYLKDVMDIRMALGREVQDIIRSMRELTAITRITEDIFKLASTIKTLEAVLTPEMVEMLRRVSAPQHVILISDKKENV